MSSRARFMKEMRLALCAAACTLAACAPADRAVVECFRSTHSVLFGPPTASGQQGQGPGWLRLDALARADSGAGMLVDGDRKSLNATWRRLSADSISVTGFDDFLRVEMRLHATDSVLTGSANAHSDAALEPDSTGAMKELRRQWTHTGRAAPCDG